MRAAVFLLAMFVFVGPAIAKPRETGALVLVIDRSGSMRGPKLEAAKAAAKAAASALHPDDIVSVVVFDSEASVLLRPQKSANRVAIGKQIDKMVTGGGTNILPGLKEASEILADQKVDRKHVILLSDGEAPNEGIADLVKQMRKAKITISTVAVQGADEVLLKAISDGGGGRLYKVDDLKTLSEVYLKELKTAKLAIN